MPEPMSNKLITHYLLLITHYSLLITYISMIPILLAYFFISGDN